MKKTLKNYTILLTLLTCSYTVTGQEYIRNMASLLGGNSVIREVDDEGVLVASNDTNVICFTLYKEGVSTVESMKLRPLDIFSNRVSDFEIFNDTVYFAGVNTFLDIEEGDSIFIENGFMGFFPLAGFPYSQVEYIPVCNGPLSKLDVYAEKTPPFATHVIMTNNSSFYTDMLFDATAYSPTHWNVFASSLNNDKYVDDVAVTDNRIVVTSRTKDGIQWFYRVWLFDIPTSGYCAMDNCMGNFTYKASRSISSVLVEHCTSDGYAIATSYGLGKLIVRGYDDFNELGGDSINYKSFYYPDDLKYNRHNVSLDVLCNYYYFKELAQEPRGPQSSEILKFTVPNLYTFNSVECRTFDGNVIKSLDYRKNIPDVFVGAGVSFYDPALKVYKYTDPNYWECSDMSFLECKQIKKIKKEKYDVGWEVLKSPKDTLETWVDETPVENYCN